MSPISKYVVRLALFASTVAALACTNATAPSAPVTTKNAASKDSLGDPPACRSGYTIIGGAYVCNGEG